MKAQAGLNRNPIAGSTGYPWWRRFPVRTEGVRNSLGVISEFIPSQGGWDHNKDNVVVVGGGGGESPLKRKSLNALSSARLPAILLIMQLHCQKYFFLLFNNIASNVAENIASNIADYSAILVTMLLASNNGDNVVGQQYCWHYCQQ